MQCWLSFMRYTKGLSKYPQRALRFGCRFGGVHFSGPPHFGPLGTFFGFFLLNLGSTAPNYPRRPPMRSSKAPPNQKNREQVLPTPSEPSLRAWQVQRSLGVIRHFRIQRPRLGNATHRSRHSNDFQDFLNLIQCRCPYHTQKEIAKMVLIWPWNVIQTMLLFGLIFIRKQLEWMTPCLFAL